MSVATYAKVLPRAATTLSLRAIRLPLTAVEMASMGRVGDASAPSLAFESFEAGVESTVGALLRDDALLESARLRRERLAELRKAGALETIAEREREVADAELQTRRKQAEERRREAARRAKQREADLERNAERHESKVRAKAAKKTAVARRTKAKRDEVIDRQERAATLDALDAEAKALASAQGAVDAERKVEVIEDTLEGQKEDRKTG